MEEVSDIDFASLAFSEIFVLEEVFDVEEKRGMVKLVGDDNGNLCSWVRIEKSELRKM